MILIQAFLNCARKTAERKTWTEAFVPISPFIFLLSIAHKYRIYSFTRHSVDPSLAPSRRQHIDFGRYAVRAEGAM